MKARRDPGCRATLSALTIAMVMLAADSASACSVCFGDPDSDMAKGAVWGVVVMIGVVGGVLGTIAGTGLFWLQRSRRHAVSNDDPGATHEPKDD